MNPAKPGVGRSLDQVGSGSPPNLGATPVRQSLTGQHQHSYKSGEVGSGSSPTLLGPTKFLARQSFIELQSRERAQALLDEGTYRELLGPFDRLESPWLLMQDVVPQSDASLRKRG
jgi:hypothetical protein